MKTFTINGKKYNSKPFDFNIVCSLEDNGISLEDIRKKPLSFVRNYLSICADEDIEWAGIEIQSHLVNGEKLDEILQVITKEIDESDFFRALSQNETENVATPQAKATKK